MKDLTENEIDMIKRIRELPDEIIEPFMWAIENYDHIKPIIEEPEMETNKLKEYKKQALDKKDYYSYVLLALKQEYDNSHKSND